MNRSRNVRRDRQGVRSWWIWLIATVLAVSTVHAADPVSYALSDVRVLYLFDDPQQIDWATVYYLNDARSCRVDLLTVKPSGAFRLTTSGIDGREIILHTAYADSGDSSFVKQLFAELFKDRRPDIVISESFSSSSPLRACDSYLQDLPHLDNSLFNIRKIFHRSASSDDVSTPAARTVVNSAELSQRYHDRIELDVPRLLSRSVVENYQPERLTRFRLVKNYSGDEGLESDFLSGFPHLRLVTVIDSIVQVPSAREALSSRARNFISFFTLGENSTDLARVKNLIVGYKELLALQRQIAAQYNLSNMPQFHSYLDQLSGRAQRAVLDDMGITWEGKIIVRDSPHGPRLKFRASLSVNGPEEVELSSISFQPYWDTTAIVLDSASRKITPHQSFVREYLVDVDPSRLKSELPEYLTFSATIIYSQIQMPVVSSIPVREMPRLSVAFQPDFHFVPPVARVDIDRVVSSMNWNVVISKPESYFAHAVVRLETPRGVFAGAYRTDLDLDKGVTLETIRIPFSVSKLFELGIQPLTISLIVEGQTASSDTGIVRIADCRVADTIKVGFLPDSTGHLEDILRMTDAGFQPLTDRSLITGDLDAYNVIVIGAGAYRNYPSLLRSKGRFEEYLRNGGSLVIFGQPSEWPEGVLPVVFTPARERLSTDDITVRLPHARTLNRPYEIDQSALLAYFDRNPAGAPAVISPSERILATPSGATLLSVSRFGDGQIIYCGLPLTEMIASLNLEAIHLFANILNY